ncbi:MAG: hypothetical protein AAGG02_14765 [Cyanobacteria bacterium P01_H01_bin.15]
MLTFVLSGTIAILLLLGAYGLRKWRQLKERLNKREQQLSLLETEKQQLEIAQSSTLKDAQSRIAELTQTLTTEDSEIEGLKSTLSKTQLQLSAAMSTQTELEEALCSVIAGKASAEAQIKMLDAELSRLNTELAETCDRNRQTEESLQARIQSLNEELASFTDAQNQEVS